VTRETVSMQPHHSVV